MAVALQISKNPKKVVDSMTGAWYPHFDGKKDNDNKKRQDYEKQL